MRRRKYLLLNCIVLVACGSAFPKAHANPKDDKIKFFDKPGQRAACPPGYRDIGRFAEMVQGRARGGIECSRDGKKQSVERTPPQPAPPPDDSSGGAQQLTVEEKDGKAPQCPKGYQQSGTFNNMTFANGKLDKKSGIYCMRMGGAASPEIAPDSL